MACSQAARWMFRIGHGYSWQSPFRLDRDWAFQDKQGKTPMDYATERGNQDAAVALQQNAEE